MKRKSPVIFLGALIALIVVIVLASKHRAKQPASANQNPLIATQDGKWTVVSPEPGGKFVVVATVPKTNINSSTNPPKNP